MNAITKATAVVVPVALGLAAAAEVADPPKPESQATAASEALSVGVFTEGHHRDARPPALHVGEGDPRSKGTAIKHRWFEYSAETYRASDGFWSGVEGFQQGGGND